MENVFETGNIAKLSTAYFLYNGQIVGQGTLSVAQSYDSSIPAFVLTLTIQDNTASTYTYNQIGIYDANGVLVALYAYSSSYTKNTTALTVTEYLYVQDSPPITEITSQFSVTGDFAEILTNALVNGGTVQLPNSILVVDNKYQTVTIYNLSATFTVSGSSLVLSTSIVCTPCSTVGSGYVVLGYYDQGSNTFIWTNYVYLASLPSTLTPTWTLPMNTSC